MPVPRLLHPIEVWIKQINKGATVTRSRAKEPVRQASRASTFHIAAQIRRVSSDDPRAEAAGIREGESGYVIFLERELIARGITLNRGDNIVQIGEGARAEVVNLYITRIPPHGYYPKQRGPTLQQAYFSDRQPTRSSG